MDVIGCENHGHAASMAGHPSTSQSDLHPTQCHPAEFWARCPAAMIAFTVSLLFLLRCIIEYRVVGVAPRLDVRQ